MKTMPQLMEMADGSKIWEHQFDSFYAKVYLPKCDLPTEVINYGFMAPYLLVFEEERQSVAQAKQFADISGLAEIAAGYGSSVVFVSPTAEGGWKDAPKDLFADLISETKISQYYKDGVAIMRDRFTGAWGDVHIRGALHRSCLYGFGASADFIVQNCLKTIEGDGLYGKGDITPVVCVLQNVSVTPQPLRRDIPVISIGNSEEINRALKDGLDTVWVKETPDYTQDFLSFIKHYRRMVGNLEKEADLEQLGLYAEAGFCEVATSLDNNGDDKDTAVHKIGYVTYGRKELREEKLPLVLCFHGGGDSAMCMVTLAEWHKVLAENAFLLVSIENHMNSTATEVMGLLSHLKEKYRIDETRIYSTGFSMGGCKSWDLFQEYPQVFAAVAPMDATFEVGTNVFAQPSPKVNQDTILPVFYVGGEDSPLPELPFQAEKCLDRMAYVLKVNRAMTQCELEFGQKDAWEDPIMGLKGDAICTSFDPEKESMLTMHLFESENGCCYSIFASASRQKHEMRRNNCSNAWKYMSQFRRLENGQLTGGTMEEIKQLYGKEGM